ncbi:MAG TPA: hypothetical protein VK249_19645 [Anaerolineales bacterium]|nr:hypothetical protein [Anaerolineales bacterium]
MNTKSLLIASLTGGLISTLLVNTPFVNLINLLFCAGFWIGPIVAVWLYRRLTGTLTLGQAIVIGMLAGAWHALIGVALSPLDLAGAGSVLNTLQPLVSAQDQPDLETALTGVGGMLFNLIGIAIDIAFGFVAGLIAGAFIRTDRLAAKVQVDGPKPTVNA